MTDEEIGQAVVELLHLVQSNTAGPSFFTTLNLKEQERERQEFRAAGRRDIGYRIRAILTEVLNVFMNTPINTEVDPAHYCPKCGRTMQVMRPGKVQCGECG